MESLTPDLMFLVWSIALCVAQMLVAASAKAPMVGLPALAGNRDNMPVATGFAGRATRAHLNMLENLVLLAGLVLVAHVSGVAP